MRTTSEKLYQIILNVVMSIIALCCVMPFALLVSSSFSSETSIIQYGYSFFPHEFSVDAYKYLSAQSDTIARAYGITILTTVVGTVSNLIITTMLAYTISRKQMPFRNILAFFVFFTMLFNGGLVPTYLTYTGMFHIKNTLFALLVPNLLSSGFYVLLTRNYFSNNIPEAVIESAKIDGAGEFSIFCRIVLPLSLPILATVGLFVAVAYWNDWYNGLIYLTDYKLFSIQNILDRMLKDIQFLASNAEAAREVGNMPTTTVKMAIAVIGALPILMIYPFFQKYFVKGISIGAVKG